MPKDETIIAFSLRVPNALMQEMADIANEERRSTNQEILRALEVHVAAHRALRRKTGAPL